MSALGSPNSWRGSHQHIRRRLPLRTPTNLLGAYHYLQVQGTDQCPWKQGTFLGMPVNIVHKGIVSCPILKDTKLVGSESVKFTATCISQGQAFSTAHLSTLAAKVAQRKQVDERKTAKQDIGLGIHDIKGVYSQAQVRATFYPKFENEKSDQEVRSRMIDVVDSGKGVLEVTLKHSGSLFMYAGHHGGAFAKNSYGNLYSAVGVFVLGRTLQEAWGSEATSKQREFNAYLEKHKLCISMELVTAVLGDHGQRPLKDYVVVTAVSDLKNKPRFFSTPDIVAFCRKWRLPTNDVWLFSSRKSATSFFTAYDALCEEGTATTVYKVMNEVADISAQASKSHMEVQGEILEGLVARIVSPSSAKRLESVLKEFPLTNAKDQKELRPNLREICMSNKGTEDQQVKALLQAVGPSMCSDWSDWNDKVPDPSLFTKFMSAKPVDNMTGKLQEMIHLLRERRMQARYPCRVKELDTKEGKVHFRLTIHILSDMVFRNYQKELRRSPGLWPLYRGFFVDVSLFDDTDHHERSQSGNEHEVYVEDDALADEAQNQMLKLKFLTYKLRTFLIRNGLSTLFESGFAAYKKYYLKLMDIWGTSASKRQQLDQMLTEWAGYITHKCKGVQMEERSYLSEAEPFLKRFAERSLRNRQLVGAAGSTVTTEDLLSRLSVTEVEDDLSEDVSKADLVSKEPTKAKGLLIFFPGIPGCAKSALCRALLDVPGGLGTGKPMHSLMGDMTKGKYWDKLAEERRRNPAVITLADKNAPNEEVWTTVRRMCQNTNAIGVPVIPDSEGTISNPFSLETLAVFIFRVVQRVNHPGNLDSNSPNAGYVLLMFYNLYEGKSRAEFEDVLVRRFGHLVKQPILIPNRPEMPSPVIGILSKGLELYREHTARHGRLESTKGFFREDWTKWEKRLREILNGNSDHLNSIQVPFQDVVKSVQEQLQAIAQGSTTMHEPMEGEQTFHNVTYAAISLPPKGIIDVLHKASLLRKDMQAYLSSRGIDKSLQACHVTLAHKVSHGVPAVAVFGGLQGVTVPVHFTAFLFSEKMCALEAVIPRNESQVASQNEWPHVTLWTAPGTRPKEANFLPQLVSQGRASRVAFSAPFVSNGVVQLF
ncbi:hypothetical protein GOP47_0004090 [Adiantum capillus-veneris]|uniref:RNA ligase n=1 Tax=Adiantum capillus-veneris TaxID=13818 RepID=A0A9D4V8L9_ADICA|nr:hypothetical protein GOP47_0004090 [Adiantum capillus-veneris]